MKARRVEIQIGAQPLPSTVRLHSYRSHEIHAIRVAPDESVKVREFTKLFMFSMKLTVK